MKRLVLVPAFVLGLSFPAAVRGEDPKPSPPRPGTPEALLEEARSQPLTPEGRDRALQALRRLQGEFPARAQDPRLFEELERRGPYGFSAMTIPEHGQTARPGTRLFVGGTWLGEEQPPSAFVAQRVSLAAYQKLLDESRPGSLPFPPRESLEPEKVGLPETEEQLESPAAPGLHVIEETIAGFRKLSTLQVSAFGLFLASVPGRGVAYAFDPRTGAPLEGVLIQAFLVGGRREARTGADGLLLFDCPSEATVLASRGEDYQAQVLEPELDAEDVAYITTDRPVYRPGETVRWKAVLRRRSRTGFELPPPGPVRVEWWGPEALVLESREQSPGPEGTLAGELRLDARATPGAHTIVLGLEGRPWRPWGRLDNEGEQFPWSRKFQVAAAPPAGLDVKAQLLEARPPRTGVRLRIEARRLSGEPAAGAELLWNVHARTIDRARTGRDPAGAFDRRLWLFESWNRHDRAAGPPDYIVWMDGGTSATGADGTFEIPVGGAEVEPILELLASAEVKDPSGAEGRGEARRKHRPRVLRITAGAERRFYPQGAPARVLARVTDLDGAPQPGVAVQSEASLNPDPGSLQAERLEPARALTDGSGTATFSFPGNRAGWLRVRTSVEERGGLTASDETDLWIAGSGIPVGPEQIPGGNLDLVPDRAVYDEGQAAVLMVRSSFRGKALLLVEGQAGLDARAVDLERGTQFIPVSVPQGASPIAVASLVLWRNGERMHNNADLRIFPRRHFLDVEVVPSRTACAASEALKVEVRTACDGKPVAAEVELRAIADPVAGSPQDATVDIRRFFLSRWERYSYWCGNCSIPAAEEERISRRQNLEEEESDSQERFSGPLAETVLWLPRLATGPDGRAEVELKAPARPGKLRIAARAVSGPSRFGQGQAAVRVE